MPTQQKFGGLIEAFDAEESLARLELSGIADIFLKLSKSDGNATALCEIERRYAKLLSCLRTTFGKH